MHEASMAMNLITAVQRCIGDRPDARVCRVVVRVGELSGVSTEALDFAFECLSRGTRLEGARLQFETVPLTVDCDACGRRSRVEEYVFRCAVCGSERTRVATGRELELRTLELEEEEAKRGRN